MCQNGDIRPFMHSSFWGEIHDFSIHGPTQDEHPNQYTLESSRIGKPSKWPEFLRLTSRRIRNHGLHRKKKWLHRFHWIKSVLNSMPDTVVASHLMISGVFTHDFWILSRAIHRAELSNSSIPGYKNSPQRRRKTSHLATLWVFKVWKTMENHHFLLGLSFINGHLYHQ
jgi:hypothetical protein